MKDRPYYRQAPSDGPNCKQLFCFKDPSGWFFATELEELVDCEPKKKRFRVETTQEYIAWAKDTGDLPLKFHVPYTCSKAIHGLTLKTNYELLQEQIALSAQSGAAASSDEGKGWIKPKGQDKKKGEGAPGGGWMNRTVDVIVPLMAGQVDTAIDQSLQICAKYDTCYWCVWRISEN